MSEIQAKYKTKPLYIGIDPGRHTGVAIYNPKSKSLEIFETDFWTLIDWVEADEIRQKHIYVLEDPAQNKSLYARHSIHEKDQKIVGKIGRDVGRNLENAYLLIEYFKRKKITFRAIKPKGEKWDQRQFEQITGLKIRTNEHKRDAVRLVYGL